MTEQSTSKNQRTGVADAALAAFALVATIGGGVYYTEFREHELGPTYRISNIGMASHGDYMLTVNATNTNLIPFSARVAFIVASDQMDGISANACIKPTVKGTRYVPLGGLYTEIWKVSEPNIVPC